VGAIVFDADGRVLLIRRGRPPAAGQWSLPGGKQEVGETLAQTCRREVVEETGLTISVGPIVAVVERIREGFHYVIIDFLAAVLNSDTASLIAADDVIDARWVALADIGQLDLVTGVEAVIRRAAEMRDASDARGLVDDSGTGSDFLAV
jgi:ADP-ribose pyrophosphatase YjhB (NUDIX family)